MGSKRKSNSSQVDKNSAEYREKRQKNNNAVKRSRNKSKQKNVEASVRVSQLMRENEELEAKNQDMTEALKHLRDILIKHNGKELNCSCNLPVFQQNPVIQIWTQF